MVYSIIGMNFYLYNMNKYFVMALRSSALAFLVLFGFRKATKIFVNRKYLKYTLIIIPSLVAAVVNPLLQKIAGVVGVDQSLIASIVNQVLQLNFLLILSGLFLYLSFYFFSNRYMGYLTDETIEYKNLLGQAGVINLKDIVKLEQKKNILSVLKIFRFLDLSRRTEITFRDESFNEYTIDIFTKAYKGYTLFSKIIENANKVGNGRIRQYVV